jgi:elongation factor P--(R)-beta-lysine ligase
VKKLKWTQELVSTSQELTKKDLLILRARALKKARAFFETSGYIEVDCPILSPFAALDNHIDLFKTDSDTPYFLHSSPEYGMKKLLCLGAPSIFQLSHVFRAHETGSKHAQEFTMAEFYKLGISYEDFIHETCLFLELFTGKKEKVLYSYKEAFLHTIQLDPYTNLDQIKAMIKTELCFDVDGFSDDDILSIAMGGLVEPRFDKKAFTIIKNFPHSQAALAEVIKDQSQQDLAMRFEIYYQGYELCNGYKEEKDPRVLKKRFDDLNALRLEQEKNIYPIDLELLKLMEKSFPDCCGVACGFDRLFMLECGIVDIKEALALPSV